jgi:hypothetical protein
MPDTITFPIRKVNSLRRRAGRAGDVSSEGPNGWSESDVDPTKVVAVFDSLHLKEGYVLWACQYRQNGNGNADVWAIPDDGARPEIIENTGSLFVRPSWPSTQYREAAFNNPMEAIEGDGTPWSYLCAALLGRELAEFGALWHGCSWSSHSILGEDPLEMARPLRGELAGTGLDRPEMWEWHEDRPDEWLPTVCTVDNTAIVRFYTYSGEGTEAIYQHTDTFSIGSYVVANIDRVAVASGGPGFVY